MKPMKVVITRDGERKEVSGWRRWAIAIPVILVAAFVFAAAVVLVLGLTFTVVAVLIVAVPAAVILALVARSFTTRDARGSSAP